MKNYNLRSLLGENKRKPEKSPNRFPIGKNRFFLMWSQPTRLLPSLSIKRNINIMLYSKLTNTYMQNTCKMKTDADIWNHYATKQLHAFGRICCRSFKMINQKVTWDIITDLHDCLSEGCITWGHTQNCWTAVAESQQWKPNEKVMLEYRSRKTLGLFSWNLGSKRVWLCWGGRGMDIG